MTNTNHDFAKMTWREDLKLIVEGKSLFVSKVILGLVSPVFNNMFSSQFKEKSQDEIELPGKSFNNVLEFLCCIYPDVLKPITIKNALDVLPLADEYQTEALKRKCELMLIQSINLLSTHNMIECLGQACLYHLDGLKEVCFNRASELSQEELDSAERNVKIPIDVKCEIQRRKIAKQTCKIEKLEESKRNSSAVVDYLVAGIQRKSKRDFIAKNKDSIWTTIKFDIDDLVEQSDEDYMLSSPTTRVFDSDWCVYVSMRPVEDREPDILVELICHPLAGNEEIEVFARLAIYNLDSVEMIENADIDCLDFGNGGRVFKYFDGDHDMYVGGAICLTVEAHFCIVHNAIPLWEDGC